MSLNKVPIGIDLGTTFSCIAYIDANKNVEIIENKFTGARVTPSVCTFNETDIRVGKPNRASENAIYEVKRLIGRKFNNSQVQSDLKNLTFKVSEKNNRPQIHVNFKAQEQIFCPEQISAIVVRELKKIAETHMDKEVKAVVTVPAYFNDEQKQATLDAANIAGLEVLKIIPEPTAAAIAYGYHRKFNEKSKILIFDLGGGTFDVSIMDVDGGEFKVLAIDGDVHLGGTDFDNRLVDHFMQIIKDNHNVDLREKKKTILRLKTKCEEIKRELSQVNETRIEIDALIGEEDFEQRITRTEFEELNHDLFERTIDIVKSALKGANLNKEDIDDVVLVGGSSRIPKVQSMLQSYFGRKKLRHDINPDEVVAFGAAIQASLLCGDSLDGRVKTIVDVIPKSLGIRIYGGLVDVIFPKNSSIPNKFTKIYTNAEDYGTSADYNIYEGENKLAINNNLLGRFSLENIKSCPKNMAKFETVVKIDENGILNVTAKDLDTLSTNQISINFQKGCLSEVSISEMATQMDRLFT